MGTFCTGRYRVGRPEGVPCGMTMAAEQLMGNRRLIELGGRGGEDAIRSIWEETCELTFAKKMPRDHGPEATSEVEELDLAL